jgi:hypothetical protein
MAPAMAKIGKQPQGIAKRKAYDTPKAAASLSGESSKKRKDSALAVSPAPLDTKPSSEYRLRLSIDIVSILYAQPISHANKVSGHDFH